MSRLQAVLVAGALAASSIAAADVLPEVPHGAQAMSLTGEALFSPAPPEEALARLAAAKRDYESDPDNVEAVIWYGRRTAYTGDYRGAIEIFSEGIEKFPADARLYRHRGHRYITIRQFDRAITDLEKAAELIEGTKNSIEPDGLPNAQNIPVSSLHGNIWYHLGLAYYLQQDWDNAYRAFKAGFDAGHNDDNRVSTTHWLYMIRQRNGDADGANTLLSAVEPDMNVIENTSYYRLCLFYQGELTQAEILGDSDDSPAGDAIAYGVANWHYYHGDVVKAADMLRALLNTPNWASFGYIAAEADLAAWPGQ